MNTNRKIEWEFIVDRAYTPLSYSFNVFINNRKYLRRYLDIVDQGITGHFFYPNDVYWNKGLREEVIACQTEHHKKEGNKYLWKMAEICEERGERLIKDLKEKVSRNSTKNLSSKDLESLFAWAVEEARDFSVFITIPWSMESYLNEQITNLIKTVAGEDQIQESIGELLLPVKVNASSKETPAIWELAVEINNDLELKNIFESGSNIIDNLNENNSKFLHKIDSFINEYGWIHIRWFKGDPITRENVVNRLKETIKDNPELKLEELNRNKDKIIKITEDFSIKHSLTEEQKDLIYLIKEYVYIRTYRTDTLGQAFYLLFPIIERASQLLNINVDDLLYYSEAEIRRKLLGEHIDIDIKIRKEMWAILVIDLEYEVYSGRDAVEKLKLEQGVSRNIDNISELKGQAAFKGKVVGKAKIVLDPHDISKVEKGDILVAVMTFPSYIAAMEKAAAFVTDEGGILCHASIIAREMKKPCVISTKVATKVFKDGDQVEVDADKGIVRIIK